MGNNKGTAGCVDYQHNANGFLRRAKTSLCDNVPKHLGPIIHPHATRNTSSHLFVRPQSRPTNESSSPFALSPFGAVVREGPQLLPEPPALASNVGLATLVMISHVLCVCAVAPAAFVCGCPLVDTLDSNFKNSFFCPERNVIVLVYQWGRQTFQARNRASNGLATNSGNRAYSESVCPCHSTNVVFGKSWSALRCVK